MSATTATRLPLIDSLRGLAILLMIAYHFCYDLTYFRFVQFDFYHDPFWLNARTLILSLFLVLVGISLALATTRKINMRHYLRRLGVIILCAAFISLTSYLMFQQRWIFFGVLHFIAVASVIGLLFVHQPWLALILGIALIPLDQFFSHSFFNQPACQWIGLMTHKPPTEDYVPLVPWFGAVLIGIFIGRKIVPRSFLSRNSWGNSAPIALLQRAGRHSLLIYMLHQPILVGLLWLIRRFTAMGAA